ncbi:hypothetical protein BCR33DRAFT_576585 [Rhizoclosmatium globosum]|uniref:Uncharacterized protein n=1 Tax=Rhizoclosmatium globosum TaxID=329046 RepID=A0A1Y2B3L2_9FUNG|nr:hypothetical protein BCR33DRAFT_576585 [Rhizoclosmatium globosum]|eukprot:ORY29418.1 hypothetical protein BCR33DRAFT_576585 [Rhizoclosmatium globosum]
MIANLVIILLTSAVALAEVIVVCAGAQDVLPTTILPLLDVKVSNTVTTAAISHVLIVNYTKNKRLNSIVASCLEQLQTQAVLAASCWIFCNAPAQSNIFSSYYFLNLIMWFRVKFVSYIDSDPTSQTTESYFTVSLTGTASTSLTTIQNEVATPKIVKMVQSPSAETPSKSILQSTWSTQISPETSITVKALQFSTIIMLYL